MNRLTILFIFTTMFGAATSVLLGIALIQEAKDRSAAVTAVYEVGLQDGETLTKAAFARALAERELMEEAETHIAEERL